MIFCCCCWEEPSQHSLVCITPRGTYANLCDGFCLPDSATRAHSFPFDRAVGCFFETFFTGFVFPLASLIDGLIDNGGLSDAVSEPINFHTANEE